MMTKLTYDIHADFRNKPEAVAFMAHIGLHFATGGKLLFAGSRNTIKQFCVVSGDPVWDRVVVKKFRAKNVFQQLAYSFFVASKAKRAYRNGVCLLQAGCQTPQPLAYAEERRRGWLVCCYYVTTFTEAESVRTELDVHFNRPLAQAFAQFMARLHTHGIVHHDLNFSNVLYERRDEAYQISVIDINRMTSTDVGRLTLEACKDDFVRWTDRWDLFEFIMREYALARGLDAKDFLPRAVAMKRQHNRAWRRRKGLTRWLKRLFKKNGKTNS